MALNFFVFFIIAFSILFTNFDIEQTTQEEKKTINIPKVVFFDSIMYQLDEENVKQIIQSKQLLNYQDRDEMFDGTILKRNNQNGSDSLSAEYIIKKIQDYKFYQNVVVNRKDRIQLFSEQLSYNDKTKILTNNTNFLLVQNQSSLIGTNLFFDTINEKFKAKSTHFKIKGSEE